MLDILSTQTLQCLIDQIVLPVVIDETSNDESYLLLNQMEMLLQTFRGSDHENSIIDLRNRS